jgi:hypothetical protein
VRKKVGANIQRVSTFIAIELCLGLTAASLPDLRGLLSRIRPGFMSKFRHDEDSSSGQNTNSRERDSGRRTDIAVAPAGGISIGGGIRLGGEYRIGKVKRPDWMRSTMTGSLWEDTHVTRAGSRETSRSRGGGGRDVEHGTVEELPHAGRPSVVPELVESDSNGVQLKKVRTREQEQETDMEKSSSTEGE